MNTDSYRRRPRKRILRQKDEGQKDVRRLDLTPRTPRTQRGLAATKAHLNSDAMVAFQALSRRAEINFMKRLKRNHHPAITQKLLLELHDYYT